MAGKKPWTITMTPTGLEVGQVAVASPQKALHSVARLLLVLLLGMCIQCLLRDKFPPMCKLSCATPPWRTRGRGRASPITRRFPDCMA